MDKIQFNVWVTPAHRDRIKSFARQLGIANGDFVMRAVDAYEAPPEDQVAELERRLERLEEMAGL
jgi:hypothetical protein